MKIRTVIGIAAIGFLYMHVRRGGAFTLASMKQTVNELFGRAKAEAAELKESVEKKVMPETASTAPRTTSPMY